MKISYVVPVYNCASNLAITIESILDQSVKPHQIIIIDDASTDDIAPLKEYYHNVIWISNRPRRGAAYCRNHGNAMCTGDVIAVCDAGDFYTKNRSKEISKFFEDKEKDLFYSAVQVNKPTGQPILTQKGIEWDGKGKPPISHTTVAYRNPPLKYHERSTETDLYEFFLHDNFRRGKQFGFSNKTLCIKLDLSGSPSYRDVVKAKDLKYEMYKKYNIELERAHV